MLYRPRDHLPGDHLRLPHHGPRHPRCNESTRSLGQRQAHARTPSGRAFGIGCTGFLAYDSCSQLLRIHVPGAALTALTVLLNKQKTLQTRSSVCVVTAYGLVNLFFVLVGMYHAHLITQCALGCLTLFFAIEFGRWVKTPNVTAASMVSTRNQNEWDLNR